MAIWIWCVFVSYLKKCESWWKFQNEACKIRYDVDSDRIDFGWHQIFNHLSRDYCWPQPVLELYAKTTPAY